MLLDMVLPDTPGLYELFVDVVEEGVCWFSDWGSPPLVCEIQVFAGAAKSWQYQMLVEQASLALLGQKPEPEAVAHWCQALEAGGRLEGFAGGGMPGRGAETGSSPGEAPQASPEGVASGH